MILLKYILIAVLTVAACLSAPVSSLAMAKTFVVIGIGNVSCGGWTRERQEHSEAASAYDGWVQGYLTAVNEFGEIGIINITKGTDMDGIDGAIDNYCATHPIATLSDAVQKVVMDLIGDRPKKLLDSAIAQAKKDLSNIQK